MDQDLLMESILISLRRILRATELHSKQLNKTVGLTFPQLLILQKVASNPAATASYLAHELSLSQATITSIVDRLTKRDLLERIRHTDDRRKIHINLTDAGRALLETAPVPLQEHFVAQLEKLEEWQQTMILSSLQKVASMMDAERIEASPVLEVGALDANKGLS